MGHLLAVEELCIWTVVSPCSQTTHFRIIKLQVMEEAWHTPLNALIQVLCQVVERHF